MKEPRTAAGGVDTFITGASGFIGRRVTEQACKAGLRVAALSRADSGDALPDQAQVVAGDLCDPRAYLAALKGAASVIHLAACTGRASRAEFERVNVEGTRALVSACESAGVGRFVYVSTIAAGYPDLRGYPYADTKRQAEEIVKSSSLRWTILRPTIVLGRDSELFIKLRALASATVMPVPGRKDVMTQPVHVDDVAGVCVAAAQESGYARELVEVGGPERLTMFKLLCTIRAQARGGGQAALRIPLGPVVLAAKIASAVLGRRCPVAPGQFSAFRYDSIAAPHPLMQAREDSMHGVVEIVRRCIVSARPPLTGGYSTPRLGK